MEMEVTGSIINNISGKCLELTVGMVFFRLKFVPLHNLFNMKQARP
jgi:hypothetical protein